MIFTQFKSLNRPCKSTVKDKDVIFGIGIDVVYSVFVQKNFQIEGMNLPGEWLAQDWFDPKIIFTLKYFIIHLHKVSSV